MRRKWTDASTMELKQLETMDEAYIDHYYHAEPSDRCHALEQLEPDVPHGYGEAVK